MATLTSNHVLDNSTLVNFKDWAQAISNAFSTFGWVQTADTGQVNWASIAAVPASAFVYEIWKANDALASTMPIFVKIEYGFSSTAMTFRVTVGTSSNGTGSITGIVCDSVPWTVTGSFNFNSGGAATTFPCYFSGNAGEIRVAMWLPNTPNTGSTSSSTAFLAIERSKDSSGVNTADYVTVCTAQNNAASGASPGNQQSFSASTKGKRDGGIVALSGTSSSNSGFAFGTVAAFPVFPLIGKIGNPFIGLMAAFDADVLDQTLVSCASLYGSSHNFLAFRGSQLSQCIGQRQSAAAGMALLMRYE